MSGQSHVPWTKALHHYSRAELGASLEAALDGEGPTHFEFGPLERVRFSVFIERRSNDGNQVEARIPAASGPSARARRVLVDHGWNAPSGRSRYYRRRLDGREGPLQIVVDAYAAVYGSVGDDHGWTIQAVPLRGDPPWSPAGRWVGDGALRVAPLSAPRWEVTDRHGRLHEVTVDQPSTLWGPSRTFHVDAKKMSLPRLGRRDRVASFEIAGQPATLTMRLAMPRWRVRLRRATGGVRGPLSVLAHLFGAGVGGGVAAGMAASTLLVWTIYSLGVDGTDQGSWVYRIVGGVTEELTWVDPGGRLPDGTSDTWPPP